MSTSVSRRYALGAAALSAATGAGAMFAADGVFGSSSPRRKSPTERVAPRPEKLRTPVQTSVFWRTEPAERLVALTFDDGPDPRWTPLAMEALAARDGKATFFQLGDAVAKNPGLTHEVFSAGHEIASHGSGHKDLTDMSTEQIRANLLSTHEAIVDATGTAPTLVRPPWGRIDSPGLFVATELGYQVALWSHHLPTDNCESKVDVDVATASPGMIILCHDGRSTPADELFVAVRRLVNELSDAGYRFVTVSDLLAAEPAVQA